MTATLLPAILHLEGRCLCGAVRYHVNGEVLHASHCHCQMCQRAHGAACGSYGNVRRSDLRIDAAPDTLRQYRSSPDVLRSFCGHCGSPLFWQCDAPPHNAFIAFSLGTVVSPFHPRPARHIFTETQAAWFADLSAVSSRS